MGDELGARLDQMLAIVEHQQQSLWPEVLGQRVGNVPRADVAQADRRGNRAGYQRWVAKSGQFHEPAAVGVAGKVIADELLRQARFADAARADERQQRRRREHSRELTQLVLAADKAGQRPRQVVFGSLDGALRGLRRLMERRLIQLAFWPGPAPAVDHDFEGSAVLCGQPERPPGARRCHAAGYAARRAPVR